MIKKLKEQCLYNQSVCSKCLTIKDMENFVKDLSRENKLSAQCNSCKNRYYSDRKKSDKLFKLSSRIRSIISKQINKNNLKKSEKTEDIIGCSFNEFKNYLESKFDDNMNWENYGEWHLDHIIPISYAKTEEEIYELNHYTNFQPLWAKDNLSKGNRFIG
jgi:type II secretory ATPase GspE/PulE/Tfp pilus assembly ATPase PilB-like protein